MPRTPIHELPPGYQEVEHLILLDSSNAVRLNLLALIPLLLGLVGMVGWRVLVVRMRGSWPESGVDLPWWVWVVLIIVLMIPLHEGLHGLAIWLVGHKPRFGMMLSKGAFYATADNALFRRGEFILVAFAPLVGITLLGMFLMLILPDDVGYYAALLVALNAGSAIGDLWMVRAVRRYPPEALVRDEADSIRIYLPEQFTL
ncbi:MAG: DUF3267 domain-containing protein [Anaerolineae bacterium]|nr:DUF3267 domain-containing protein [Anaerolineae bacterium]